VADPLGLTAIEAAWGIHETINEDVARAFRVHASERGVDYRRCGMVVFGGSGPLHGTSVARKLRIPRVVCPLGAGVMSAFGLLASPIGFEIARSRRLALADLSSEAFEAELSLLETEIRALLAGAGVEDGAIRTRFRLDMRYVGQGYEVEVPVEGRPGRRLAGLERGFAAAYRQVFGLALADRPVEIVNWKVEAEGPPPRFEGMGRRPEISTRARGRSERPIWLPKGRAMRPVPVIHRQSLGVGDAIEGPALIEEEESTCLLQEGDSLRVDEGLNLVIAVGGAP
jgi:N-methylhydantoinase A